MQTQIRLKDGRVVKIRIVVSTDYEESENDFVHRIEICNLTTKELIGYAEATSSQTLYEVLSHLLTEMVDGLNGETHNG